jgi:hypothetical protein
MKQLFIALGVLALVAAPVFAQGTNQRNNQGTTGQGIGVQGPAVNKPAPRGPNSANDVYCNGQYVGSDPDPNIRLQMLKAFNPGVGGCAAD